MSQAQTNRIIKVIISAVALVVIGIIVIQVYPKIEKGNEQIIRDKKLLATLIPYHRTQKIFSAFNSKVEKNLLLKIKNQESRIFLYWLIIIGGPIGIIAIAFGVMKFLIPK